MSERLAKSDAPLRGLAADYELLSPIGRGANGQTFRGRVVGPGAPGLPSEVVIKVPLLSSGLAFSELKERLDVLNKSLEREIVLKNRLRKIDCVAQIVDWGYVDLTQDSGIGILVLFAVQQFVEGKRLDEFVCDEYGTEPGEFSGIPSADAFFEVSLKVARSLRLIHQEQIVHGDVWFKNVILGPSGAVFIDFGKSALQDLNLPRRTPGPAPGRFHPPEGRGSVKGDIFDLGGLLFYLATGDPEPPDKVRDNDELKRRITKRVKEVNPKLYDENSGLVDIIARCRRFHQYERFHNVEGLIQDLETFCDSPELDAPLKQPPPLLTALDTSDQPLFSRLGRLRIRAERRVFEDMIRGVYDLTGDHEDIVSGFTRYLSTLRRDDQYLTLSIPAFWRKNNLGVNGRVLVMNKIAALRGATIRRVFLLTEADRSDPEIVQILEAHINIGVELAQSPTMAVQTDEKDLSKGGYYTGFVVVRDEERRELVDQRNHFGLLIAGERPTVAAPVYTSEGHVVGLEFRTAADFTRGKREFFVEKWLQASRPLREFLPQSSTPGDPGSDPGWIA